MRKLEFKHIYPQLVIALLAAALLTTVAGFNITVLLLFLATPWFWTTFEFESTEKARVIQFFALIAAFCSWDIATNILTGASLGKALSAMSHDLRPFVFVVLLWPIFAVEKLARFALWAVMTAFVAVAGANLLATLLGPIQPGQYLWRTMHQLHGQMSAGAIFLLAQLILVQPKATWRTIFPLVILVQRWYLQMSDALDISYSQQACRSGFT